MGNDKMKDAINEFKELKINNQRINIIESLKEDVAVYYDLCKKFNLDESIKINNSSDENEIKKMSEEKFNILVFSYICEIEELSGTLLNFLADEIDN